MSCYEAPNLSYGLESKSEEMDEDEDKDEGGEAGDNGLQPL
jgi:hypothetical protein